MEHRGYHEFLIAYIENQPSDAPIYTDVVSEELTKVFGVPPAQAKSVTNVGLKRIADKGGLERFIKGVYYKAKVTPFGKKTLNADVVAVDMLTRKGDMVIGYETGPSLCNRVGLTTQMPKDYYIATNAYNKRLSFGKNVVVRKPAAPVDLDSVRYLQTLDLIGELGRVPADAQNPGEIIRGFAQKSGCDTDSVLLYARRYYSPAILMSAVDILIGGAVR